MSRNVRLLLASILLIASVLSLALWAYLVTQPPEVLIWDRPATWWLAALSSLLGMGFLVALFSWIAYLLLTTPYSKPIEEQLEEERAGG